MTIRWFDASTSFVCPHSPPSSRSLPPIIPENRIPAYSAPASGTPGWECAVTRWHVDAPKKLRKLMSIAAGWREGNSGRVGCGEERGEVRMGWHDEGECAGEFWGMTRRVLSARGVMRVGNGEEHGEKGEMGAQGEPVGLYVIDEAVIATGLHSTPRYCHQTMHIHR